ncbi:hypothetical protein BBK82_34200 [Lentzea guizhouensis]|uniref:Uncharacterized protein n=1 Tax=Lentzea guizhouensis TaxID=1586287 RepID=A0A1B2HRL5_9PSEU|nr:hypothetical protein [Lentzea guizhouensis]ANZ40332.1 hypothetical protein BBK82_34200 [Lentzea guizhouensis]
MVAPASSRPYWMEFCPVEYRASATGSVYSLSCCATTNGHRKLFQLPRNVRMPSVASAGPHSGRMILAKIRTSLAPSTRPASSSSPGSPAMNCRIRNTPNGETRNGRISAGNEFASPALTTSTYSGTNVTTPGIIRVAMTTANNVRLPRNSSLASA